MRRPVGDTILVWGAVGSANFGDRLLVEVGREIVSHATGLPATLMWAHNKTSDAAPRDGAPYDFLPRPSQLRRAAGFVVAGGTHVHDAATLGRALLPLRAMFAAVAAGVPSLALGIGADERPGTDQWLAQALAVANLVTVRERHSFDRLSALRPTVRLGHDLVDEAIRSGLLTVGRAAGGSTRVGFAPSAHLLGRWAPSRREAIMWVERFAKALVAPGRQLVLLESAPADSALLDRVDLPGLERVCLHRLATEQALEVVRDLEGLLTMRFHVGLLAQSAGIPVASIGADPKLDALGGIRVRTWPAREPTRLVNQVLSTAPGSQIPDADSPGTVHVTGASLLTAVEEALGHRPTTQQRRCAAVLLARVIASKARPGSASEMKGAS